MFMFKKIVSQFLLPLPVVIWFLLSGLVFLWFTKRQTLGRILVTCGLVLLYLFSHWSLADRLLSPIEKRYPYEERDLVTDPPAYIVVLGGGHTSDPNIPATSRLSTDTLSRVVEGIRLQRESPGSKLVLCGGTVFDPVPEADSMYEVALQLGVRDEEIILERDSKDTKDQARLVKEIVGEASFLLVTSASHMPRSLALFEKVGLSPRPAPAGFMSKAGQGWSPGAYWPSSGDLRKTERAFYEIMGTLWGRIRGLL